MRRTEPCEGGQWVWSHWRYECPICGKPESNHAPSEAPKWTMLSKMKPLPVAPDDAPNYALIEDSEITSTEDYDRPRVLTPRELLAIRNRACDSGFRLGIAVVIVGILAVWFVRFLLGV